MSEHPVDALLHYVQKLLSFRPRSVHEMRQKLTMYAKRHALPEHSIEEVLMSLQAAKIVDDGAFCRWWMQQREDFSPRGKRMICMELRRKGISDDIISSAINQYKGLASEYDQAVVLAKKRFKRLSGYPLVLQKKKTHDFLLRRGYTSGTIRDVIDSLFKNE